MQNKFTIVHKPSNLMRKREKWSKMDIFNSFASNVKSFYKCLKNKNVDQHVHTKNPNIFKKM